MRTRPVIFILKFSMLMTFYLFSFVPLIEAWLTSFTILIIFNEKAYVILGIVLLVIGVISTYGILTLYLKLRRLATVFFSLGIIFSYSSPYFLSLGIVLSWFFYEIWRILWVYSSLEKEYEPYSDSDFEKIRSRQVFTNQIVSLCVLAWTAISVSWLVLFITSMFYIQLGEEHFGTIGISLSIAMLLILYIVPRFTEKKEDRRTKPLI